MVMCSPPQAALQTISPLACVLCLLLTLPQCGLRLLPCAGLYGEPETRYRMPEVNMGSSIVTAMPVMDNAVSSPPATDSKSVGPI